MKASENAHLTESQEWKAPYFTKTVKEACSTASYNVETYLPAYRNIFQTPFNLLTFIFYTFTLLSYISSQLVLRILFLNF
jgi:hypothetical protein